MGTMKKTAIATGFLCIAMTSGQGLAQQSAPEFLQQREYQICIHLARTEPAAAFEQSLAWADGGGGPAAMHCGAIALINLGHYPEAAKRLEDLGKTLPDDTPPGVAAEILAHAGLAWIEAGDLSRAYAALTSALELSPANPDILTDRATVLFLSGKYWESIDDLNKAIDVSPDRPETLTLRASAYRYVDTLELALDDATRALDLDPDYPEALLERGNIYRLMGRDDDARRDWLHLVEVHQGRPAADHAQRNLEMMDVDENR